MSVAERHRAVDFEIEGDGLAPFDVLDNDMMHRQASARRDHQHPLEDGLVVEPERVGGKGQIGLGPASDDAGLKLRLERRYTFEREGARHRQDDIAHDLGAAGSQPDRLDSCDAGSCRTKPRMASVSPSGARSTSASIVPAKAVACRGDEHGDSRGRRTRRHGRSGACRRKPDKDKHGGDEIARIMQRVGG